MQGDVQEAAEGWGKLKEMKDGGGLRRDESRAFLFSFAKSVDGSKKSLHNLVSLLLMQQRRTRR
jgi:hypothetical protein